MSPSFPLQTLYRHPILHSGPQKQRSQNFLKTAVQRPPRARTRPCMRVTHVTARPGITLLAMAENHIRTSSMGFQCVVQCCYEQNAPSQTRVGRLLATPPSRNGPKAPKGGGHWRGGSGRGDGGVGGREGRLGGGVHVGRFGVVGGGGAAQAPVTSPGPPSRVRARARVTELVEPVLVL